MTNIRAATKDDIPTIASLHIEGWKGAYGGIVDQAYLDSLTVEKRTADWTQWMEADESTVFIAEEEGKPAGFVVIGRTKTPPPGSSPIRPSHSGEIYALYLHPDFWRRGIGTALIKHAARELKERKHSTVCLWVLDANTRARAFYEKMGGQKLGGKMIDIGPSKLKEVCYGWRDTSALRA
ncbi:MAG: N-acetyltransferase [Micavibrio aeruginosavorus]|uniref:N-acetyltransferase n=1 Tax=Micavibrio aeruginosavorus TaxID=349221 RepID=A0A2W4ZJA3_9BACT|nr:MAG: N-acetyltransferase [Micavibrio aeruginosavorus]